ncbi:MAG: response regulator [Hyphomonadaceae bacterium]
MITSKFARVTALIVDPNPHHRSIVSEILRAAGVTRIFTAQTSEEALQELRMWHPLVMIVEWNLESVDGIELTKRIRRGEAGIDRTLPIVMLTTRNTVADVEVARQAGVHEYAIKPVSSGGLLARIEASALKPRRFVDSPVYVGPCRRRKMIENYSGPKRRLADPVGEETQRAMASASVLRIAELSKNFDPGDRNQVRAVFSSAKDAKAVAQEVGDHPLDRSADSLVRYIEGMGATERLDPEIVQTHVDALSQLITLPNGQGKAREMVADGLEAVVQKKMRATAAG